jgi:hypothetical protein
MLATMHSLKAVGPIVVVMALAFSANGQPSDCSKIQDPTARLSCYDEATAAKRAKPKSPAGDEFDRAKRAMLRKLTDPESARWGELFRSGPVVCGKVNSKNRMGGYVGMTGFVYFPTQDKAIKLYTGTSDPEYTYGAMVFYCKHCVNDPRGADYSVKEHCDSNRRQIDSYYPKELQALERRSPAKK